MVNCYFLHHGLIEYFIGPSFSLLTCLSIKASHGLFVLSRVNPCGFFGDVLPLLMPEHIIGYCTADTQFPFLQSASCYIGFTWKLKIEAFLQHICCNNPSWPSFSPDHPLVILCASCIQGGTTGQCTQSEMPPGFLPLYMFLWIWDTETIYILYICDPYKTYIDGINHNLAWRIGRVINLFDNKDTKPSKHKSNDSWSCSFRSNQQQQQQHEHEQ